MGKIVFIGAGPGAPDLLTIRAKRLIDQADIIIYAGSLVNPEILSDIRQDAVVYNSATMTLPEVIAVMEAGIRAGKRVVRVHTGDPSIYGAHREQMRELDHLGIGYEVVPGVSSFLAAAASLNREYTLPGVSQTVILTRMEGRTAVPQGEQIETLAAHQASMVIFLSVSEIETLCRRLMDGGYPADTPAAVVYKASWEDEKRVAGDLSHLAQKVAAAGIRKTALVMVGQFLGDEFACSCLYDEEFSHGYRKGTLRRVLKENSLETGSDEKTITETERIKKDQKEKRVRAKRIMIQGTMSNSGKSFLTAALCRIFMQDGLHAAPFKSQNMALNSYITADGLEIGRAQVMQAEAAGIEPTVDMNPILLKPTSQMGSQVIVRGEVIGNMRAMEYYRRKPEMIPVIRESFDRLAGEYDVIVLEGAGSPAEINLRENDIVNMGMAEIAEAPVILVADIDRGGVFASLYGTVELLKPEERARIRGLVINKFRGDGKILEPGLRMIEERLHIPVIGVIPMEKIDLEDEDSLSSRLSESERGKEAEEVVDIAVIRLPHIANFTDYNVFERMDGVSLRYVGRKDLLGHPDCILIPGTKNTMEDLRWLRSSGIEEEIRRRNDEEQTLVIGICGGYQMLGEWLEDPLGVEGAAGEVAHGMGLLPSVTVFEEQKTRTRIRGKLTAEAAGRLDPDSGDFEVSGYEIHMGTTDLVRPEESSAERKAFPVFLLADGRMDGLVREDGLVFGSYLHGLFDHEGMAEKLIGRLADKKGLSLETSPENVHDYKNSQYDKLADLVRRSLDMDAVYRILRESEQ